MAALRLSAGSTFGFRSTEQRTDSGAATAELAAVLPVLVLLLAMAICIVTAVVAQLRCVDAAREAARAAARGDPLARVVELARRAAPRDAVVRQTREGEVVVVTVSAPGWPLGGPIRALQVSARAAALSEPTAA